ncbi:hypothetical protein WJX77_003037 [Trebouxia sp. C0004]
MPNGCIGQASPAANGLAQLVHLRLDLSKEFHSKICQSPLAHSTKELRCEGGPNTSSYSFCWFGVCPS